MKQEISTQIANASTLVAVSTSGANKLGWFEFISTNAPGISVIIGICSFLAALFFYTISLFKQSQASKNEIEISYLKKDVEELKGYIIQLVTLHRSKDDEKDPVKRSSDTKL